MSLLFISDNACLIDHNEYIFKIYKDVISPQEKTTICYRLKPWLFSITRTEKTESVRKRKRKSDAFLQEVASVKEHYQKLLTTIPCDIKERLLQNNILNQSLVRDMSKNMLQLMLNCDQPGNNSTEAPLKVCQGNDCFLVPGYSSFKPGCVMEGCKSLITSSKTFDMVVADPPWWNKYIRRLRNANDKLSYSMMYNEDIAAIPVKDLLSTNCIVAVWCTNAPSNIAAVKDLIFPKWGVEYLTTWFWLKITADLKPLCDFAVGHQKQPYERIMIGKVGEVGEVPIDRLVVSVPSALHSHKPPLLELLTPFIKKESPQTLELFARYLLPHTTSVGYEPLKWQNLELYETV